MVGVSGVAWCKSIVVCMYVFFLKWYGDHRDLHRVDRRQRQMCIRDRVWGRTGSDVLHGDRGDDELSGSAGRDVLYGGDGADVLTGGKDADRIFGGDGNDTIRAVGGGADVVDCGRGRDRVQADSRDRMVRCEVRLR